MHKLTWARLCTISPTLLFCKSRDPAMPHHHANILASRFGPNTFPANNSALYACETQVAYTAKALFEPLLDGRASVIEVKESVENRTTNEVQQRLQGSVFSGNCSNWYIGEFGRNAASWPGLAIEYYFATLFPDWNAFNMKGGSRLWLINSLRRWIQCHKSTCVAGIAIALALSGQVAPAALTDFLVTRVPFTMNSVLRRGVR